MEKEIKVTKLTIELGNKTIELSVEDARKLHDALNDIFQKEVNQYIPYSPSYPIYPTQPFITWCDTKTYGNKIVCNDNTITYSY